MYSVHTSSYSLTPHVHQGMSTVVYALKVDQVMVLHQRSLNAVYNMSPPCVSAGTYFLPPSSCLKIRGMFSPTNKIMSNDDVTKIVDAILERSIGNRVVHVVVDRKSADGVVYLR